MHTLDSSRCLRTGSNVHFDTKARTIFFVRHGSHAYGTNIATSDEDFKGVAIAPRDCYLGFVKTFEQHEHMGSKTDGVDSVVYAINKFAKLAADSNPNIIEVLNVAESDIISMDEFGEELRSMRDDFLSKRAKHTFSGYATAQLKRIKLHKGWHDKGRAPEMPKRSAFGLPEGKQLSKSDFGILNEVYEGDSGVFDEASKVANLFLREKAYKAAMDNYNSELEWLKNRNESRAALEKQHGFDTKHGLHLVRLMRMCEEILEGKGVIVKRPDFEELLQIRAGAWEYDQLVEYAESTDARCNELYKTSKLRHEPDRNSLDARIIDMTERYLSKHG